MRQECPMPIGTQPRRIVLDCDPGTDDAVAVLLALASPELAVAAITVAGGNAPLARTLANARGLVALAGAEVPVHAGADRALLGPFPPGWAGHGTDGLAGVALPAAMGTAKAPRTDAAAPDRAADAIRAILRGVESAVTLVGIAPATNLALALATEPALAENVEGIVLMSGAWGEGNATPAAEFNAWCDPDGLAIVLGAGRPVTLATLEIGREAMVTPARLAGLRGAGHGRCLATVAAILGALPPSQRLGLAGAALYDPVAIAWLIRPELCRTRPVSVAVDLGPGPGRGRTVIDRWGQSGAPANALLLEALDADGFFQLLAERLARLP
jgi:inosine-uridine nucleoside N-ribohydrolase